MEDNISAGIVPFTKEEIKKALPPKAYINDNMVDVFNELLTSEDNEDIRNQFKENLISYSSVLLSGRYQTRQYVNAVKYCTYKVMGLTNKDAYRLTFPERMDQFALDGKADKDVESYISAFNRSKLVTSILSQAYVPIWLVNQDARQKAVNTLLDLLNANSEKVRRDAADSLLNHLKPEEAGNKFSLNVAVSGGDVIENLSEALKNLVNQQQQAILEGKATTKQVIELGVEDVTDYTTADN